MNETFELMVSAAKAEAHAIAAGATPSAGAACNCGTDHLEEVMITETHPLGEKGDSYQVEVPMVKCLDCGFAFTDFRAEQLRHIAACRHLGLFTPGEVKALRDSLGMSRREFDEAFGIPPASMERWENGRLMQNRSMNTLLKALSNPATAARLDQRTAVPIGQADGDNVIRGRFAALEATAPVEQADVLARRDNFRLRKFG